MQNEWGGVREVRLSAGGMEGRRQKRRTGETAALGGAELWSRDKGGRTDEGEGSRTR